MTVRETLDMAAGILDMAAIGDAEAPADPAFNLKGALQPAVRDDDVEYEGMCRCLVEMLLNKEGMFSESLGQLQLLHTSRRQEEGHPRRDAQEPRRLPRHQGAGDRAARGGRQSRGGIKVQAAHGR